MKNKVSLIALSSMCVALAFVLSNVKLFKMPFGGSITAFSMLVISLPGFICGFPVAFVSSVVYGLLQFVFGGYMYSIPQVVLDYIFAFGSFSLVGLFKDKKNGLLIGFSIACICRFIFSTLSGVVFFSDYAPENMNPFLYSILYNGAYIFAEMILSYIVILLPITNKLLTQLKNTI